MGLSVRRQVNSLIGLIIPRNVENASQAVAQAVETTLWRQEQEYLRKFPCYLREHNMKVYDIRKKDSRGFWRLHYEINYIKDQANIING